MRKKIYYGTIILLIGLLYYSFTKITAPYGNQKVEFTTPQTDCYKKEKYNYCVHKYENTNYKNVAYYLHGRNLNEKTWLENDFYTAQIQKYWQDNKLQPPLVISISYGDVWLLTKKNSAPESGLLTHFIEKVIPEIEDNLDKIQKRMVFGESMGGLNSLVLGLTYPNYFYKVASLCPAVYNQSPFASFKEKIDGLARTGANPKIIFGVTLLAKKFISNEDDWNNFSPLKLIDNMNTENKPKFYLSCGLYDQYGNYEGSELLFQKIKNKDISIEWHPIYGGHCASDISSVAKFLTED